MLQIILKMVEDAVARSADEIEATKLKGGSSITETVQPDSNKPGFPASGLRCDASDLTGIIGKLVMYVVERN
ncbi:MAG: hypothetical protein LKJ48_02485 [Lactobacillus sp.]|jgi:hypothetical protein|nr:hypothetical protein [Lactobacillus sp.]